MAYEIDWEKADLQGVVIANYEGLYDDYYQHTINYLNCLDCLHPVAMKVKDEILSLNQNLADWPEFYAIINSCSVSPKDGMYIDLFNAVYDGIVAINEYKKEL